MAGPCSIAQATVRPRARGKLIKLLLGRTLIDRWELWRPAIHQAHGRGTYPMFEGLAEKLRRELGDRPEEG